MSSPVKSTWASREVVRIQALPTADLILELTNTMNGHCYSWRNIKRKMRHLEVDNSLYQEWNDLCMLKDTWESFPSLTRDRQYKDVVQSLSRDSNSRTWNPNFLRLLLIKLKLILIRAGLEEEQAIQLVSQNLDELLDFGLSDLWKDYKKYRLDLVNKEWDSDNLADEKVPLLGGDGRKRNSNWLWRKWSCFLKLL